MTKETRPSKLSSGEKNSSSNENKSLEHLSNPSILTDLGCLPEKNAVPVKTNCLNIHQTINSVIFKALSYCFEERTGFDVKALFASRPLSHLIGDITKEF